MRARCASFADDAAYVDAMLIETTRRLIGCSEKNSQLFAGLEQRLNPLEMGMSKAWETTARYLETRIQSDPSQKPGRAPDLSEEAAAAMKTVMFELAAPPFPVGH